MLTLLDLLFLFLGDRLFCTKSECRKISLPSSDDNRALSSLATPLAIALCSFHYTEKARGEGELILGVRNEIKY